MMKRILLLMVALGLLIGAYLSIARPWLQGWGATAAERAAQLPGDALVPHAQDQTTRAITINAPIAEVWGWVAQLGQDRGGFYSYDILENLVGCEMPRVETLSPALQRWQLGDSLWMYPPDKMDGVGAAPLRVIEQGRVLAFATRQIGTPLDAPEDGSWSFIMQPRGERVTRLIVRGRGAGGQGVVARASSVLAFEPVHFVMERRMLVGIAALAEGHPIAAWSDALQVLLWTLTFGVFVISGVRVLRDREPLRSRITCVLAGVLFASLTLVQPSPAIGAPLVLALGVLALLPSRLLSRRPAMSLPTQPEPT